MVSSQELVSSMNDFLLTLKASSYLTDQFGNKIIKFSAVGTQLIQIEFDKKQPAIIEHVSQFRCYIHK